ncbi:uncharacterized protein LOC134820667 [Bolinopsis microptera]|uniref:uncharacterized protein LOC134820667 n=1 Tax=Bolinopsis microptera TaxID=2820187 RepID=UPI00307A61C4
MKISGEKRKWLTIFTIIFYAHASSVCASIRYGFLADAFSRRNIPGKIYGLVGTSLFLGFGFMFFSQGTEKLMRKWSSRSILLLSMLGWAIVSLLTGFAYSIPDTTVVIAISFVLRICQGVLSYTSTLVPIDFINANFPEEFDMVNGLVNMGYFSGHGVAEAVGCVIYDKIGYTAAYGFTAVVALLAATSSFFFIPNTRTYLSTQDDISDDDQTMLKTGSKKNKLTKLLIIPMIATMLINANYGVIQVTVTPFLKEEFNKSISYGGTVLTLVSIGMATGSVSVGVILQKKILNPLTAMGIGATCIFTGLLVTFPPQSLPALYELSPILAYPGVFTAGLGDPIMTIATLRALCDIQLQKKGLLTPKMVTRITSIWIVGYSSMYYAGSFIAGTLMDYFSYSASAEILAGFCLIALLICIGMRLYVKDKADEDKEKVALIKQ